MTYSLREERLFFAKLFGKFGRKIGIGLDVGCGYGVFTRLLEEMGYDMYGVDLDFERITRAHEGHDLNFLIGDSRRPPFRANTFGLVLCRGYLP
jgi:2-polyprenyl-3-methyl-5-hydroxy-6-metoxy-1,4-benzoquinol methylase